MFSRSTAWILLTEELNKNPTTLCMYQAKDRKQMSANDAGQIQPRIISTLYDFAG
jgi:hypothetical protein